MEPAANAAAQPILGQQSAETQELLNTFWERVHTNVRDVVRSDPEDFKSLDLPLARIKKIMKLDEDVHGLMISQEAPVVFAKAAEIFISELTLGAWVHTEENRRRTIQRCDIAQAIANYDQFDFLIDIVPREELRTSTRITKQQAPAPAVNPVQTAATHSAVAQSQQSVNLPGSNVSLALDSTGNLQYVLQIPANVVNGTLQQQAIQIQLVPNANNSNQLGNVNVGGLNIAGIASASGQQQSGILLGNSSFQLGSPSKTATIGTQQIVLAPNSADQATVVQLASANSVAVASPAAAAGRGRKSDVADNARRTASAVATAAVAGGKANREAAQAAAKRPAAAVASAPQRGRAAAAKVAKRK